jgi:cell division cycle protein 20 (cofactor of APC complex)
LVLPAALAHSVYLWQAETSSIKLLMSNDDEENYISSVRWMPDGSHLAIGCADSSLLLWDVEQSTQVRAMAGHTARVGSLDWNGHILSSGSKDTRIMHSDVRMRHHIAGQATAHDQEVCGLRWSPSGDQLASGSNGNDCLVFDRRSTEVKLRLDGHKAAVKALAWVRHCSALCPLKAADAFCCPFRTRCSPTCWPLVVVLRTSTFASLAALRALASTRSTPRAKCARSSGLATARYSFCCAARSSKAILIVNLLLQELVSAHGFSDNQLTVWKYSTLTQMANLTGSCLLGSSH